MSKLDDELARAVEENEAAEAHVVAAAHVDVAPDRERPRRSIGLLVALLVMAGGILTLVLTGFEDAAIYSKGVDELMAESERLRTRNVRVEGMLVKGTLSRRDDPCEYRFRMQKNGKELPVRFPQCVVPDTFRDVPGMDVNVTAEGKLGEDGQFVASTIFAKCPSKYEMQERAAKGEAAPHEPVRAGGT